MKVEIYSDVVCPWCYIGERRFERALAAFPDAGEVEVVFKPFQLDPGASESAIPLRRHLEKKFGPNFDRMTSRVGEVAEGEGITIDWDRALSVNTRTAHRLGLLALAEYGPIVQRALMEALFAAHFTHGRDVADHGTLTELAVSVGMDAARVRAFLESGEAGDEVVTELAEARSLGVQAVPTFVFDGQYVVEGGQPASTFLQVLEEVKRLSAEKATSGDAKGEACEDGSCAVDGAA